MKLNAKTLFSAMALVFPVAGMAADPSIGGNVTDIKNNAGYVSAGDLTNNASLNGNSISSSNNNLNNTSSNSSASANGNTVANSIATASGVSASGNSTNSNQASGNNTAVSVDASTRQVRQAPALGGQFTQATATCLGGASFGLSVPGGAVQVGGNNTVETCVIMETARTAAQVLGQHEIASEVLCGIKHYREARKRTGAPCMADIDGAQSDIANPDMSENHSFLNIRR